MTKLKYALSGLVLLTLVGCNDSEIPDPEIPDHPSRSIRRPIIQSIGCEPVLGSQIYPNTGASVNNYNCNEYLQAALLDGEVNLNTGLPLGGDDWSYAITANLIKVSQNFIRVCDESDAEAISHLPYTDDHVALILGNSSNNYAYGTASEVGIWGAYSALHNPGPSSCDYEYIASIENIKINGPYKEAGNYRFTLANMNQYPFVSSNWEFDATKFDDVVNTETSLVLSPITPCPFGSSSVRAVLNTSATLLNGNGCPNGVLGVESGTKFEKERNKTFSTSDCGGSLNGGSLYTFNYVSSGTHQIEMNSCNMTWVRTSGNASFQTSNNGKELTFTLNSGSVSFHAYGSGCDLNFSFYAY